MPFTQARPLIKECRLRNVCRGIHTQTNSTFFHNRTQIQGISQVWPPTQYYQFFINNHGFSRKAIKMIPSLNKTLFLFVHPNNSLVWYQTLEGLFNRHGAFWALNLASSIASRTSEIQGHHQVCHARRKDLKNS